MPRATGPRPCEDVSKLTVVRLAMLCSQSLAQCGEVGTYSGNCRGKEGGHELHPCSSLHVAVVQVCGGVLVWRSALSSLWSHTKRGSVERRAAVRCLT